MGNRYPYPLEIGTLHGAAITEAQLLTLATGASDHSLALCPGAWVTTTGVHVATAGAAAAYVVDTIFDASFKRLSSQYVTAAALNAAQYYASVKPIGKMEFIMAEDALATPITDANQKVYADIIVAAPTAPNTADNPFDDGTPNILIDSSTVNASSSGLLIQLLGLAGDVDNAPYSSTASASPRWFKVKVIDAAASVSQP
jgi:hypothetical protein